MARKDQAAALLKAGNSPSQIASLMGITIGSVAGYLYTKVGEGAIRRSDILFSIDADTREIAEELIQKTGKDDCNLIFRAARREGYSLDYGELEIYLKLRDSRISLGDMYEFLCELEIILHEMIKNVLTDTYGAGENGWWRKGIPSQIRTECVRMREEEKEPAAEPFCYTTFIHLSKIIDTQWSVFSQVLPQKIAKDKKKLLSDLAQLNVIRNYVMHPVKGMPITEDDFAFVRKFHR